ncbi:MAG: hypothetical protein SVU32_02085 [Candidatus Nanohaloarchaea archaeon]|nr:hypothetical protein [Candidatus Nanohaloarchaea archaeon]
MMDYETVIRAIIEREARSIGDLALRKAGSLEGIRIDDDDGVTFTRAMDKDDVNAVIDAFRKFQGEGAVGIARRAMDDILEPDDDIDLPEEIVPQRIKEKRFVKGI